MPSDRARYIVEIDDSQARRQLRGLHAAAAGSGGGGGPTSGGRTGTGGAGGTSGPGPAPTGGGGGGATIIGGGGFGGIAKIAGALAAFAPLAETIGDFVWAAKPVFDMISRYITEQLGAKGLGDAARADYAALQKTIGAFGPAGADADPELISQVFQAYRGLTTRGQASRTAIESQLYGEMTQQSLPRFSNLIASFTPGWMPDSVQDIVGALNGDPRAGARHLVRQYDHPVNRFIMGARDVVHDAFGLFR